MAQAIVSVSASEPGERRRRRTGKEPVLSGLVGQDEETEEHKGDKAAQVGDDSEQARFGHRNRLLINVVQTAQATDSSRSGLSEAIDPPIRTTAAQYI